MLRLDEDLSAFHESCRHTASHRRAADARFGRLLRGACLFEDLVKVICTCNVTWRQTVAMLDCIVRHWGVPSDVDGRPGFPTPFRLARVGVSTLRTSARVGYRAEFIHRLAKDAAAGTLDLNAIERFAGPSDDLYRMLRTIHGIGDYAAGHLCMLLGRYDRLAIDTEILRFLRQCYPRRNWTPERIRQHYRRWHPHQFLAYWYELWRDYVDRHGQSEHWHPDHTGRNITAAARRAP